jgi:hypothetical protein
LFEIDAEFIMRSRQENPHDWGSSQPRNAFHETKYTTRQQLHLEDRLSSGDITGDIVLHLNWLDAPNVLQDPRGMVRPDELEKKFPQLRHDPLNPFEEERFEQWGDPLVIMTHRWCCLSH